MYCLGPRTKVTVLYPACSDLIVKEMFGSKLQSATRNEALGSTFFVPILFEPSRKESKN